MQDSFCVTIRTADREKGRNYLLETLGNLERSGFFASDVPMKLAILDTGKGSEELIRQTKLWLDLRNIKAHAERAETPLTPNQNAILALEYAAQSGCRWHLFLEDDIDVCGDFLNGLAQWMADNAREGCAVYPLCAAYGEKSGRKKGKPFHYALNGFYGTQAYVVTCEDSGRIAQWMKDKLAAHPMRQGHDLLLKEWSIQAYPDSPHFLCPTPDFVQHIGRHSSLHPERFHDYAMFAGHNWSYRNGQSTYFTLQEHQGSKMSRALALLLAQTLPKDKPVYDLGCGMGRYVSALEGAGFMAVGIEGTPGIEQQAVTRSIFVHDLSKLLPQVWHERPKGSVISIEVGEHIRPESMNTFISNLVLLCDDWLVLTWAVPGQKGLRHVNEMNADKIVPRIESEGFALQPALTKKFREQAGKDLWWFKKSIYVFRKA